MGRLLHEFTVGEVIEHPQSITITQEDNAAFCRLTHNTQPLHLDRDAAIAAGFRDFLVNGLYTFAATVGVSVPELTQGTLIANLGYEAVTHPAPVYPGDTLRVESEILSTRASSKPGRGIVLVAHRVYNQENVLVCQYSRTIMVKA